MFHRAARTPVARLIQVSGGPAGFGGGRTYAYDGGGNRTSVQIGAGTPVTTTYDGTGLPTSSSDGTSYSHDAVGNLTAIDRTGSSNDWLFTYGSWNTTTKAARTPAGSDVVFTLDALDRVLSRASGTTTATYTYQGMGEILAKAQVGNASTTYVHTDGGPLAQKAGNATRYYVRDLHGDLVAWSDTKSHVHHVREPAPGCGGGSSNLVRSIGTLTARIVSFEEPVAPFPR